MFKLLAGVSLFAMMFKVGQGDNVSVAIAIALLGAGLDTIFFQKK